jgi:hypothetical protein
VAVLNQVEYGRSELSNYVLQFHNERVLSECILLPDISNLSQLIVCSPFIGTVT